MVMIKVGNDKERITVDGPMQWLVARGSPVLKSRVVARL